MTIVFSTVSTERANYSMNSGCTSFTVIFLRSLEHPYTCWQCDTCNGSTHWSPRCPFWATQAHKSTQTDLLIQDFLEYHIATSTSSGVSPSCHQSLRSDSFTWYFFPSIMKKVCKLPILKPERALESVRGRSTEVTPRNFVHRLGWTRCIIETSQGWLMLPLRPPPLPNLWCTLSLLDFLRISNDASILLNCAVYSQE